MIAFYHVTNGTFLLMAINYEDNSERHARMCVCMCVCVCVCVCARV